MVNDSIGLQIFKAFVIIVVIGSVFTGAIYLVLQALSEIFIILAIALLFGTGILGFLAFHEDEEQIIPWFIGALILTAVVGFMGIFIYQVSHTSEAELKIEEFQKEFEKYSIIFELQNPQQLIIAELEKPVKEAVANMCEQSNMQNCDELTRLINTGKIVLETIPDAYSKGIALDDFLKSVSKK